MSLGSQIRKIRKDKGYSIMKVRELTGLSKSTISDIENDKSSPTSETMRKLADAFGCHISYFFDSKYDTKILKEESSTYDVINLNKSNIINIPIVGSVRAGEPILATENITGYHPTLKNHTCRDKNYFYLRVQGDSMNQEFNDGDLLLIEQTPDVENGSIAVVLIDGMEATVKKVVKNENMITLIPMSTNPKYVPHMYDVIKDEIKIIGRVKEAIKIY